MSAYGLMCTTFLEAGTSPGCRVNLPVAISIVMVLTPNIPDTDSRALFTVRGNWLLEPGFDSKKDCRLSDWNSREGEGNLP